MTALRKPRSYDAKPKSRIDTRDLAIPKKHFLRDSGRRAFVRTYPCALLGENYGDCPTRKIDCAHVGTGGMGIKSTDALCAPLCTGPTGHHRKFDQYELPRAARKIIELKAREIAQKWERLQAQREARR